MSRPARAVGSSWQQQVADALVAQVPCDDRDVYLDDLTFWDSMRGYDCVDGAETVSIRVYQHGVAVDQVVDDWADTIGEDRHGRRGNNWLLVGPGDLVDGVIAPSGDPEADFIANRGASMSPEQDYLTMCVRYSFDEISRRITRAEVGAGDAKYYEQLFPGVRAAVHDAISGDDVVRGREQDDEDRWNAMFSAYGPELKRECRSAARRLDVLPNSTGGA